RLAPLLRESAPARLFEECLKMFLSGHAEASFLGLEKHGLLAALFPETAAALAANRSGALRRMLVEGMRGTDARVAAGEPVSPAFLFALLLWPAYCRQLMALQAQGMHAAEAQRRAADRVTLHQLQVVALPRRFSTPMQEIWLLQSRFGQRKRVGRLLAHPRFRDRKSTRLNSSHVKISYAVFCLKKKKRITPPSSSTDTAQPLCSVSSDPPPPELCTLSLHDALPISRGRSGHPAPAAGGGAAAPVLDPAAGDLAAAIALRPAQAGRTPARAPALP